MKPIDFVKATGIAIALLAGDRWRAGIFFGSDGGVRPEPRTIRAVVLDLGGSARLVCREFQDTNRVAVADRVSGSRWKRRAMAERRTRLLATRETVAH